MLITVFTVTTFVIVDDSTADSSTEPPYNEGNKLYVWALNGLNLRQQPSPSAPIIQKLNYGTGVTVLKQKSEPVPYQYRSELFPCGHIILNGHWIKIKANKQEGYAFNQLLQEFTPKINKNYSVHYFEALVTYFVRVFSLKIHQQQKKQRIDKEFGITYDTVYKTFISEQNQIVLKTKEIGGDASTSGEGGEFSLLGFSFEKAFIFFYAVMPPDHGCTQTNHAVEYAMDAASEARLEKTKKGVRFEWDTWRN